MPRNNVKYNLESAKSIFVNNGYIPLFNKYTNCSTKLLAQTKDGYKFEIKLADLKNGYVPKVFNSFNPHTIENIKIYLKLNNKNFILINEKYIDAHTKMKFKCLICNNEFDMNWNNIKNGKECRECSIKKRGKVKRLSKEEILANINDESIEILDIYWNKVCYLNLRCKDCGNEWISLYHNLRKGKGCKICSIKKVQGKNHHHWKGGVTPLYNYLRNVAIKQWKQDSIKNCGCRSVITGDRFDIIHHLYGFNLIFQEMLDISGLPLYVDIGKYTEKELRLLEDICLELHYKHGLGVCLTNKEHKEFHKLVGTGDNTPEQFEIFKNMKIKELNKIN